ncbi:MAG: L,D-transpeptidase family protein [Pseudomonadota bacterium]
MKTRILAGAACAALIALPHAAFAAALSPELPVATVGASSPSADAVAQFYASRANAPLWLSSGSPTPAATAFLEVLDHSALDGLASGPQLAARARAMIAREAVGEAEQTLSNALVMYGQAIQSPPPGMAIGDAWAAAPRASSAQILAAAAAAPSLSDYVRKLSAPNPVYTQLRDAAFADMSANAGADERIASSLARVRTAPFQRRYIIVDAASANLWMIEDGKIAGSMKVIVGKAEAPTPMLASTIYYATLNPYWNVPGDLVQSLIAPRVAAQGVQYITDHNYDVLSDYSANAQPIDPKSVDWSAVAAGKTLVKLRQRPNPANSMGKMKFGFPNASDIFLHDSPNKDLFAQDDRSLSHGCIRLSDAPRLARWLLGRDPTTEDQKPEQHVLLPTPVPIYVTYLTAQVADGRIAFVADVYGRDRLSSAAVASLK